MSIRANPTAGRPTTFARFSIDACSLLICSSRVVDYFDYSQTTLDIGCSQTHAILYCMWPICVGHIPVYMFYICLYIVYMRVYVYTHTYIYSISIIY